MDTDCNMSFEEKKKILLTSKVDVDSFLCLFFSARNNAIDAAILAITSHLMDAGFRCSVYWRESSMSVCMGIILKDKYEHERHVFVNRDAACGMSLPHASRMLYSLKSIVNSAYYSSKKPKVAQNFDDFIGTQEFFDFMAGQINRCNYPFGYTSHSCF